MDRNSEVLIQEIPLKRKLVLAVTALLAPFYFIFPGHVYDGASQAERKLVWIFIATGFVGYAAAILLLAGR